MAPLKHHADFNRPIHSARHRSLASVEFVPPSQGDDRYHLSLRSEVRFGEVRLSEYAGVMAFTLRISEATLTLSLENCEIPAGTERLGDREQPSDVRGRVDERAKIFAKSTTSLGARLKNKIASIAGKREHENSIEDETKFQTEVRQKKVLALSGDRWKFLDPLGGFIEGRFMGGFDDDPLCNIKSESGEFRVSARLTAFPKNIRAVDVSPPKMAKKFENATLEQERLIQIAIARSLARPGEDEIELATSMIEASMSGHEP